MPLCKTVPVHLQAEGNIAAGCVGAGGIRGVGGARVGTWGIWARDLFDAGDGVAGGLIPVLLLDMDLVLGREEGVDTGGADAAGVEGAGLGSGSS